MPQKTTLPTFFISHGGGPWPYMPEELAGHYRHLAASLNAIPQSLRQKPSAILMVSAHWEEADFTLMTHPSPPMFYDYGGFPSHTYQVKYPATTSQAAIKRVTEVLENAGIKVATDAKRGFDHGAFVPLAVMYPKADIPVVQLSLRRGLDPLTHLKAGEALAPLRQEGVLIIGSGLSYHNLRRFGPSALGISQEFDAWLGKVVLENDPNLRSSELLNWSKAPSARDAHPREEHLVPIFMALGAALNENAQRIYHEKDFMGGVCVSSFRFG